MPETQRPNITPAARVAKNQRTRAIDLWVAANRAHPEHVSNKRLIARLANDDRLLAMWRELSRRKPDGKFVYSPRRDTLAQLHNISEIDSDDLHSAAIVWLFKQFLHEAVTHYPGLSEVEATAEIDDHQTRAKMLRKEADDTDRLPIGDVDWRSVSAGMRAKADILEQAAAELRRMLLVTKNKRENIEGITVARRISAIFQKLYGTPLHNQTAVVASAITGESVTPEQVRQVNRSHPAYVKFITKKT